MCLNPYNVMLGAVMTAAVVMLTRIDLDLDRGETPFDDLPSSDVLVVRASEIKVQMGRLGKIKEQNGRCCYLHRSHFLRLFCLFRQPQRKRILNDQKMSASLLPVSGGGGDSVRIEIIY